MYEEIVAEARRAAEAAVLESRERVEAAVGRAAAADRRAAEATREIGDRWLGRVDALRRRAHDATGHRQTELRLGPDDDPDAGPPEPADPPPAYGRHALADEPEQPRWPDDDEDYSAQSWLEGR